MPTRSGAQTCSVCGYTFNDHEAEIPCPNCKSTARTKHLFLEGTLPIQTELEVVSRGKDFAPKWWIIKLIKRFKIARSTGLWAKEELRFDRSAANTTVKTHHVEERQPEMTWSVVHDEKEEYKAKKRPWLNK